MSVQVEPYQLRFLGSRITAGSQEIRLRAKRLEGIMNELVQGSWKGAGAYAFAVKCEMLIGEMQKTADVLNNAVTTLNRFAMQMERVNQLRQQSIMLEQQSWQYGGNSIDDLHYRQNLARQASQLLQEAEWEANAADSQAANEFNTIMSMIPQILEQINQYHDNNHGACELDDLPEPMRSYYLRHRDLLEEESSSFAQMKQEDEGSLNSYITDREQLMEALKAYYISKKPDNLTDQDKEEAAEDDLKYFSDLSNDELYDRLHDLMQNDELAIYYANKVQQPDFDAKDQWFKDLGYQQFVKIEGAQYEGPGGLLALGTLFAAGVMKVMSYKYGKDKGKSSEGNKSDNQYTNNIKANEEDKKESESNKSPIEGTSNSEAGSKTPKYSEAQIQNILEGVKGGIKDNPLRQAYEAEVIGLAQKGEQLLRQGMSQEEVAKKLYQARRDLGVKYKDATPQPLLDYIYEINQGRYGDPLGPSFEKLIESKSAMEIIESSSRPNDNVDKLLSGFEQWLRSE